jgi:DNA-binding NarL/FixJ family response regulator
MVREGLRRAIDQTDDLDVVGEGSNGEEILRAAEQITARLAELNISARNQTPGAIAQESQLPSREVRPYTRVVREVMLINMRIV